MRFFYISFRWHISFHSDWQLCSVCNNWLINNNWLFSTRKAWILCFWESWHDVSSSVRVADKTIALGVGSNKKVSSNRQGDCSSNICVLFVFSGRNGKSIIWTGSSGLQVIYASDLYLKVHSTQYPNSLTQQWNTFD
jgi:hypothetical protein